ncbi:aminoglycoside N(3)-acetyltransferase [Hamadaea tsunoensis]|uniref:aminoglycoside N(3)-acetyltransferase n=1 Tax=Hamadaea tsunoensis TaxID=53368 RepID=UPI0003F531BA|nr:AAC(3) family N-acetyltransferase [Hamadaea tsunoensis]
MSQPSLLTVRSLAADLRRLGVDSGDVVMLHSSMRSIGSVIGGSEAVVYAILEAIGPDGTLAVPTHTPQNCDPAGWAHPPAPADWWPVIRSEMPGFDAVRTPSRWMGVIAETVRTWPSAVRSGHPQVSCAALGPYAADIVRRHPLEDAHGEGSPLGVLYRLDAKVLLLGCGYSSCTSLHLAETRQAAPPRMTSGASVRQADGSAAWVTWDEVAVDEDDFDTVGAAFEATGAVRVGQVGQATGRLMAQRALVDFATAWMADNRK